MAINRRTFMKRAAGAAGMAAWPTIIPSHSWGATAPNDRINLGCIGVGSQGRGRLKSAAGKEGVQIVAVSDAFGSRREWAKDYLEERQGKNTVQLYDDFQELLARDDIDGVVVGTTDHWHVPISLCAARAGKDIYCEKPLTTSLSWAWELRKVLGETGRVFQYGTQQRSSAHFRFACELVRNGTIGEIKRIEVWCPDMSQQFNNFHVKQYGSTEAIDPPADLDYNRWIGPAPMSPYTVDRCTNYGSFHHYDNSLGFISVWGAHPLDIAQWGIGMDDSSPVHYEGKGTFPQKGLYNTIHEWDMQCTYANNISMRFMSYGISKPAVMRYRQRWSEHGTTFFGTEGWVSVDRGGMEVSNPKLKELTLKPSDVHLYRSRDQMQNFVDCMRTRRPTVSPIGPAVRSDTISHMTDICIRQGRPIQWDPQKEQIVNDPIAARMLHRSLRSPWTL